MELALELAPEHGASAVCEALGVSRSTLHRRRSTAKPRPGARRGPPARALSGPEREAVAELLHSEAFVDLAPAAVYARLLDEGRYLCSARTMYRILAERGEARERRDQRRHPRRAAPVLVARAPNQCWSWDITKLRGPAKWKLYCLYVVLDIFSRCVVGWLVADRESNALAGELIEQSCRKQRIDPGRLVLHADRGPSMTSKSVALLLADLGVSQSHSRPRVSNDNPFSEAQFKTLKYRPDFPARFGSPEDARKHCREFFLWYNTEHRHSGIGWHTPEQVHYLTAQSARQGRADTLLAAWRRNPERFPNGRPVPPTLPPEVWINRPVHEEQADRDTLNFFNQVSQNC